MAKDESKRISPGILRDDIAALAALSGIGEYDPRNEDHTVAALTACKIAMQDAQGDETRQTATLRTSRDVATAKEWEFHNAILRAKEFVIAQFGKDSNEVQAVGLKKKSDYSRPTRNGRIAPEAVMVK